LLFEKSQALLRSLLSGTALLIICAQTTPLFLPLQNDLFFCGKNNGTTTIILFNKGSVVVCVVMCSLLCGKKKLGE